LRFPKTRVVNCADEILAAALQIGFPLLVKPNIGGRGAGIVYFESIKQLRTAIDEARLDFGIDQTVLVQEFIPARNGHITRLETLGGKFLYAIDIFAPGQNFNLCPAEICQVKGVSAPPGDQPGDAPNAGLQVKACNPPHRAVEAAEKIAAFGGIDVGGVEYMVDDRNGRAVFYDINPLSNFLADAPRIIGFNPHTRLVDFLEQQQGDE
jgi:glutathione synthase/RimK-type ligase-like ATP-grasp enzyme